MQQRDYLLREIEKFGAMLSVILQKICGGKENPAITLEKQNIFIRTRNEYKRNKRCSFIMNFDERI